MRSRIFSDPRVCSPNRQRKQRGIVRRSALLHVSFNRFVMQYLLLLCVRVRWQVSPSATSTLVLFCTSKHEKARFRVHAHLHGERSFVATPFSSLFLSLELSRFSHLEAKSRKACGVRVETDPADPPPPFNFELCQLWACSCFFGQIPPHISFARLAVPGLIVVSARRYSTADTAMPSQRTKGRNSGRRLYGAADGAMSSSQRKEGSTSGSSTSRRTRYSFCHGTALPLALLALLALFQGLPARSFVLLPTRIVRCQSSAAPTPMASRWRYRGSTTTTRERRLGWRRSGGETAWGIGCRQATATVLSMGGSVEEEWPFHKSRSA